ncbi:MAG: phosphate ABC transporter ATP-binding protein [Lachnoanaerobaculum saburreum]|jgi:phosphate uptake ABC transporter
MENAIEVKTFSVSYGSQKVLDNVSFSFKKNKITAILGNSGCGKTTFLHALNNLLCEEENVKISGDILLEGKSIYMLKSDDLRKKIGLVFQTPIVFPMSIYKNMTYAINYHEHISKKELDKIVEEKLMVVGLYDEVKDSLKKSATKLSGGQKQRLCIARALTINPEVLLLDEPCSALDIENTMIIEKLLKELKESMTVIIVTHNIEQAKRIGDEIITMDNGKIFSSIL